MLREVNDRPREGPWHTREMECELSSLQLQVHAVFLWRAEREAYNPIPNVFIDAEPNRI